MSEFFRVGVGALIVDPQGRVLAFERADVPGAWQLPQGGVDRDEPLHAAALREVEEETGIAPGALTLLGEHPVFLGYELPADLRSAKTERGQCHRWFLFRLDTEGAIDTGAGGEFRAHRWLEMRDLIEGVVGFRRPVYEELARYFGEHLRS